MDALAATGWRRDVEMLFHGTTIATNALLTGGLARVVLATTAGSADVPATATAIPRPPSTTWSSPGRASWCRGGTGRGGRSGCPAAARC